MSLHITHYFLKHSVKASVNLHRLKTVKAHQGGTGSWITFQCEDGHEVTLHVDGELAERLGDAFTDYENWLSSQDGPTFDEALGAKCDAAAAVDVARALK